jgi:hypothetical protein
VWRLKLRHQTRTDPLLGQKPKINNSVRNWPTKNKTKTKPIIKFCKDNNIGRGLGEGGEREKKIIF